MTTFGFCIFLMAGIAWATIGFQSNFAFVYRITHDGIHVKYLGLFDIVKITYNQIDEIKIIPMSTANVYFFLPHIRFGTKLWGKGAISIRRKSGWSKLIIITPPNPISFIEDVKLRM